jgi:hypothetical protein
MASSLRAGPALRCQRHAGSGLADHLTRSQDEFDMDEKEFKRHLKDLAHGHHHPEEHDWNGATGAGRRAPASKAPQAKRRTGVKASKTRTKA